MSTATTRQEEIFRQLEDVIRQLVPEGEIVTHFDLLVHTRVGPDASQIKFRRFTAAGSDPLLSMALLDACRRRLRREINRAGSETD